MINNPVGAGLVPAQHTRKIIRLQYYDYAQNGLYFITICVQNRLSLFGNIIDGKMFLNAAGEMIQSQYFELEKHFKTIKCLNYVIMPNHMHFILQIENIPNSHQYSLFDVMQRFKSLTTGLYIKNVTQNGWKRFHQKLWQRSYYEHIIRNDKEYTRIAEYIDNNPINWQLDSLFVI